MSWRASLTLVLLAAAVVLGWSAWRQHVAQAPKAADAGRSDYVLHDFELVALGKEGQEAFTLRAPLLQRDPADRTLDLQTPLFLIPDRSGDRWEVRSRTGWVAADNSEVRLRGQVVATSPLGSTPTTMKTEQLNLFPDRNLAVSPVRVTVTSPGSTMQGSRMRANLADKRVQLTQVTLIDDPTRH